MKNCSENAPCYILFGKEALYLYSISVQHLLNDNNVNYTIGTYTNTEDFEKEKEKWDDYIRIDYHVYLKIKSHQEKQPGFLNKVKNKFLFWTL